VITSAKGGPVINAAESEFVNGKKNDRISIACSSEFRTRLAQIAKAVSRMKGKDITPGELAFFYLKHGMENDLGRIFLMHGDLQKFLGDFFKG
jgi:hypothetical protein